MLELLPSGKRHPELKTLLISRIRDLENYIDKIPALACYHEKIKFCTNTLNLNRALLHYLFKETWL